MGKELYYFAVAKFISNILRNEPRNFGIVLFGTTNNDYHTKFMSSDSDMFMEVIKHYEDFRPTDKEEFLKFIEQSNRNFIFSSIGTVAIENPEKEVEYLYETFVK